MIVNTIGKKCKGDKISKLKRSRNSTLDEESKFKIKKTNNNSKYWDSLLFLGADSNIWVSATKTANYLLKDPLVDWLEKHHNRKINHREEIFVFGENSNIQNAEPCAPQNNNNTNVDENNSNTDSDKKLAEPNILFQMGNKFENVVVKKIREMFPDMVRKVCNNHNDVFNRNKSDDTYNYMKQGIPIIEQAMLTNDMNKTYGVADLLVRSDFVNKLFKKQVLDTEDIFIQGTKLSGKYHYIVIDIKWSHIPISANGKTILNKDRYLAYKGQLAIYNLALGIMQDYIPKKAYIMGKGYTINSKNSHEESYDCFDRLAEIHYHEYDKEYIESTASAVKWIRDVEIYGKTWDYMKPHRREMYPNMCIENYRWNNVKKMIAKHIGELTDIWMVGYDNRECAHQKNVYSWRDPKCCSSVLGITGTRGNIINKLLEINRSDTDSIYPTNIRNNMFDWQNKKSTDFFIDFETLNECLVDTDVNLNNSKKNTNVIYMIGISYIDYESGEEIKYKSFVMDHFDIAEENRILKEFMQFVDNKSEVGHKSRLFHWSSAECNFLKGANKRHNDLLTIWMNNVEMVDVNKIFYDEPIIIKNMTSFKLKNVGQSMHKLDMIGSRWANINVDSGDTSIRESSKYYREKKYNNIDRKDIMNDIIEYNKMDCTVLLEIVEYLRKNNCKISEEKIDVLCLD